MSAKVTHRCDLCEAEEFESISRRDRKGRDLETVVCRRCGLISHARIPCDAELTEYYAREYRREYHGEFLPSAYRVVRDWNRGRNFVEQLASDLPHGARVFEVGSGIGCTVMNFALAGFDASGIEPGEGFRKFSVERLHARVQDGLLEDLPPRPAYDAVLLVHVLEHLPHPTAALMTLRRTLAPGGKLYVEVPNFAAPHAAPGKQFHFDHIYNFTPATLRMLAAKTGFEVARAYTAPFDKVIGYLLAKVDDEVELKIEPQSYAQSIAALRRYSTLTYHLRPTYIRDRLMTVARHISERINAKSRVAAIEEQCAAWAREQARRASEKPARRKAA